jgi:hypothetical protein
VSILLAIVVELAPKLSLVHAAALVCPADPNLLDTLEAYDGSVDFLRSLELDGDALTKAIIGTMGDLDAYQLPDAKGYTAFSRCGCSVAGTHLAVRVVSSSLWLCLSNDVNAAKRLVSAGKQLLRLHSLQQVRRCCACCVLLAWRWVFRQLWCQPAACVNWHASGARAMLHTAAHMHSSPGNYYAV